MNQKVVVITGASRGIGRSIALEFAKNDYFLALCSRSSKNLEKLENDIKNINNNYLTSSFDIRREEEVNDFIKELTAKKSRINILINNAGTAHISSVEETSPEMWDEIMDVNLKSTFLMVRSSLPFMSSGDHIINIGSNASKIGFPNWSAYCASKFGMLGFTNSLREELRGRNIKVSAVLPGPTNTGLWKTLDGEWNTNAMIDPGIVAKTVFNVATQPENANIDEIDIVPSMGRL